MKDRKRRAFRLPGEVDREVEEEVAFHIEEKAERLRASGVSEEEARRRALDAFGDVERVKAKMGRQHGASLRGRHLWDRARLDLRFALRQIARNPGFATATILTLALGIGSTTAIFSVVDGILFRPLPFSEPEELTAVWADWTRAGGPVDEWGNFPNYYDLAERSRTLEALGVWGGGSLTLTGRGEPQNLAYGIVSRAMFSDVLQVAPALGRGFLEEEDQPGAPGTVILTDGFWRRELGADPGVVGSALTLNDEPRTVVGVLPPDFDPPFVPEAEIWLPRRWNLSNNGCGRGGACLRAVARLAEGVTLEAARAETDEIAGQLEAEYPEANLNTGFTLRPLRADMVADARSGLLVLLSAVGLVLLIACVNVANLLMARASGRVSELAVRSAIGAGRERLITQLLTESAVLAGLGGILGIGIAFLGTDAFVSAAPQGIPRLQGIAVDGRVLAFAVGATLGAGLLFSVIPALRSVARSLQLGLHEGGRGAARGTRGIRSRAALVSGQIGLALMLLVGAGLLLRTFQNLRTRDLGFQPEGVLAMEVGLPSSRYPDADAVRAFTERLEERAGSLPGVEAVGVTHWLPLTSAGSDTSFNIEGRPAPPPGQNQAVWFRRVTPGYRDAMGLRLVAGRWIDERDVQGEPRVVVINDGMASRFFPGEDPIGERINLGNPNSPEWREIVGVVAEARYFGIRDDSRDALYLPYAQSPSSSLVLALRSERDLATLSSELRTIVGALDSQLAVGRMTPMETLVGAALGPERLVTSLLSFFAVAAVALAVVGLYGVVSYGVGLRLREMGVRIALGAEANDIRRLVLRVGLTPVAAGLVLGVSGGLVLAGLMQDLLFGVEVADPTTYLTVSLILTVVAVVAALVPARRAARIDPIQVLRAE